MKHTEWFQFYLCTFCVTCLLVVDWWCKWLGNSWEVLVWFTAGLWGQQFTEQVDCVIFGCCAILLKPVINPPWGVFSLYYLAVLSSLVIISRIDRSQFKLTVFTKVKFSFFLPACNMLHWYKWYFAEKSRFMMISAGVWLWIPQTVRIKNLRACPLHNSF